MSNVSIAHTVVPFIAGETKALTGQRLAKVGYKTTTKTPAKFPSIAVSVPQFRVQPILDNVQRLLPYIGTMLENAQDGVLRSLYESSDGTLAHVTNEDISIDACIAFLASEAEGDRLTKVTVENWFTQNARDTVFVMIAEKLGFTADDPSDAQTARIEQSVKAYRDIFASLSGGKTMLAMPQIQSLRKVLELVDSDDVGARLAARLNAMEKKHAEIAATADLL